MIVFISPAKTMKQEVFVSRNCELPLFIEQTKKIVAHITQMSVDEIKHSMKVNDKIANDTVKRFQCINFDVHGTPVLYTYNGIQYKSMRSDLFTQEEMDYANHHIRIISGLYGILLPNTSIYPYRLEMQTKLMIENTKNLYEYWNQWIEEYMDGLDTVRSNEIFINLASNEYSKVIEKHILARNKKYITCIFKIDRGQGNIRMESTALKKARGLMVEYIIKQKIRTEEELKKFKGDGYSFYPELSSEYEYIFIKPYKS